MAIDASTLPPMLTDCPICHNLAEPALREGIQFDIHDNEYFSKSAATKCLACKTIHDGVLSFVRSTKYFPHVTLRLRDTGEFETRQRKGTSKPELVVQVLRTKWDRWKPDDLRPLWDDSTGGSLNLQFYTTPGERSPWPVIPEYPEPSFDSTSDIAIAKVRNWLDTCTTRHKKCGQNDTDMPTRALFVGDAQQPPYLVSTTGKRGKYVALTWRWGSEPALTTTKHSLHDHELGIPWSHLPYLFRDAASVTRNLGIDYLWIDALCIIQDSDDDWINEASKMTQVYGNAYLTIAADACNNSFHSLSGTGPFRNLFVPSRGDLRGNGHLRNLRRSNVFMPCPTITGPANVKVRLDTGQDSSGCHGGIFTTQSSLKERGWCLQEHILSRRLLHFGAVEMFWQCVEAEACECHGEVFVVGSNTSRVEMANMRKSFLESNTQASCQTWLSIVEEFTSRSLTKQKDRLPALEGLAKLMTSRLSLEIFSGAKIQALRLAGMWRSWIGVELAWFAKPPSRSWRPLGTLKESARISSTCTWSWASITGSVQFAAGAQFDVLFASQSSISASDRDSELPPGRILVRGRLWRNVILGPQPNSDTTKSVLKWAHEYPMYRADCREFRDDDPRHNDNERWHPVFLDVWQEKEVMSDYYCALEPPKGSGWALLLKEVPQDYIDATAYATFQRVGMICHIKLARQLGTARSDITLGGSDVKEQTIILV